MVQSRVQSSGFVLSRIYTQEKQCDSYVQEPCIYALWTSSLPLSWKIRHTQKKYKK